MAKDIQRASHCSKYKGPGVTERRKWDGGELSMTGAIWQKMGKKEERTEGWRAGRKVAEANGWRIELFAQDPSVRRLRVGKRA